MRPLPGRPQDCLEADREKGIWKPFLAGLEEKIDSFAEIREFFLHPAVTDEL